MKTVTTYAEKKAKQFLNLLQGYTKGIRFTAILILLLMGISNAWAVDFTGGKIYFRNDVTNWTTSNIQIFAHQSGYTWVSDPMNKVPDTKLYYINASCNWGGFVSYRICGNSSKWGSGGFTNQSSSSKYTGTNTSYGLNGGSIYLITPASASNGCTITPQWYGSNNDFLKYKATVKAKTSTDGSNYTTISSGNWPATITIKGTYLSGDGKTARNDVATSKGASGSYDAVATGLITMTYSSLNSEYAFVGWGTAENAPSSTSESYEYNIGQPTTVYAFFKKKYTITFDANGHGTAPSSQTIIAGAKATEPAEPAEAGYTFGGWYKDADCTNAFDFNTAITNNVTLYAKWTQNATYSLTVVAGNGISQVAGSKDPVTLGSTYAITATPKTGYTFSTWTANPAENATFSSATTANTTVTVNNGSVIVTASATEIMSTLTTSNQYNAGDPGYEVPAASVNSIGYETTATVTATAASNGYTFTGWTLTNCTRTDGGAADATSITVRSNGDSKAATVVANYAEDLTTSWVLKGSFVDDFATAYKFVKKSGESTGKVAYVSLDLADSKAYQFKVVNGDTWYGNNNSNEQYWIKATTNDWVFYSDNGNCYMKSSVAGTYTFKIDFSGTNPKVSVQFPAAYRITYGVGTNEGTDKVTTDPTVSSGSLVLASTEITFSKSATKAGYTWKNWNSKADGTGTILGTGDTYVSSNRAADITVYACYDLVGYTVTLDPQEGTGGTASVSAKLNNPMPKIELPTREAYDFGGYYDAKGGQGTPYYKPDGTSAKNWDKTTDATLYAHWIPTEYNITYELNGGTNHASNPKTYNITQEITLQDPTYTGHIFKGWFDNADFTGDAILSISAGSTGAKTFYAKWEIGTYEITLDLQQGTGGTQTISATFGSEMPAITTPTREGYLFNGYYDQTGGKGTKYYDETGKNIKNWNKGSATLYAYWIPYSQCIFFKNTLGWPNVYVYTFSNNVWYENEDSNTKYGPGVCTKVNVLEFAKMTQINNTDIYYYILTKQNAFNYIAFSDANMNDWNEFHGNNAIYRADRNDQLPLFIPKKSQTPTTTNSTKYYSSGIWMKYNSTESGYIFAHNIDAEWREERLVADAPGGYHFATQVSLGGNTTYNFKVKNIKGDWFGKKSTTMTSTNTNVELEVGAGDEYNVQLTTTSPGFYIISIDLAAGKMMVSVEYPLQANDYRLVYVESEVLGQAPYTKFHPAQSIRYQAEGENKDTISFYVNTAENPAILLQQCTSISDSNITWEDIAIQAINGNGSADPVGALAPAKKTVKLYIGNGCPNIDGNGVYNFVLEQTNTNAEHNAQILSEETHPYEGDYYIRTNAAEGGWRKYNTNPDNLMTHSLTALEHGGYDYYFCKWVTANTNVSYAIANKYSYQISNVLNAGDYTNNDSEIPHNANVRFTWNSSTNAMSRAYINGSGDVKDRYLVLIGDANLKDLEGNTFDIGGLYPNEAKFQDMGNWLYQLEVKASDATEVKLTANYNGKIQYFKGSESNTEKLIAGAQTEYPLRLVYDFKTNYFISGLINVDNSVITDPITLKEVMIVRQNHEEAKTIKVSGAGSVTAEKIYGVMTFDKATLNDGTKKQYERALYWVSFPFDVKLDEVFGFGNYGEHWIMEYYDGAERAAKGLWKEPTYSYWKYITNPDTTLRAGQGYVLCLDLDLLGEDATFWYNNNTEIALYFPSAGSNITINSDPTLATTILEPLACTIDRDNRKLKDSNWNIIGVPSYANANLEHGARFYYNWNPADNSYQTNERATNTTFNTMHAYMVQYEGTINWAEGIVPQAIAARRNAAGKDQYTLRLALQQDDAQCDHTFIRLQEDNATAEFDMNYDLCKIINSGANIYSMIGNVEVAANVLPMQETTIPLGVEVDATDTYTFSMPDGTDGITAILIDYVEGTETNLLFSDYTTTLNKGINNNRFAIRLRPSHVATEVENTAISTDNVHKYIINGALYILNNGQLYDAQGRMVQP